MSEYRFLKDESAKAVPVANVFIDKYMPAANAAFVKVYLYGLRQCFKKDNHIENRDIAKVLNMLESDVVNAWKYWESIGAVALKSTKNTEDFDIEFADLTLKSIPEPEKTQKIILDKRPNYSPEEISIYIENNENIRYMYNVAQRKLGKMLSSSDVNILYGFYDWLGLPVEVIIMLLEYAVSINKRNIRYIEKIAIDWADKGINTIEKAERYLKKIEESKKTLNSVKKILGISDRLSDTQKAFITTWTGKMNLPIEVIKKGYEISKLRTGKLSFEYLNSVLKDWHKRGIYTVKAVDEDAKQHREKSKARKVVSYGTGIKTNKKGNKFINFKQREYDYDELERLALESTYKYLKESRSK